MVQHSSPITGIVIKRYDANGNLIENKSPSGAAVHFSYDALNRITQVDYPGDSNDIAYTYDQADQAHGNGLQQLTRIETTNQIIDYRYDDFGRKIAEITGDKNPDGHIARTTTLQYHYLTGDRLDEITYPDGSAVHYHFDKDRIIEVIYTDAKSHAEKAIVKNIEYAPFGMPIAWTYGNGLRYQKKFDIEGNIQSLTLSNRKKSCGRKTTAMTCIATSSTLRMRKPIAKSKHSSLRMTSWTESLKRIRIALLKDMNTMRLAIGQRAPINNLRCNTTRREISRNKPQRAPSATIATTASTNP